MNDMVQIAIGQGIFCGLFVWILMDTRKDTKERELEYQKTIKENQSIIKELSGILPQIREDITDIKQQIFK